MEQKTKTLEARLVEGRWLSADRLDAARQDSLQSGHSVWYSLVKLRYLSQEDLMIFLACESGIPYVRIEDYAVQEEVLSLLAPEFCVANSLFPLFKVKETLFVASSNPFDAAAADAVSRMSGMGAEFLISTVSSIRSAQEAYWNLEERMFEAHRFAGRRLALQGVGYRRKSERLCVRLPVVITVEEASFVLSGLCCVNGTTTDISQDAAAAGVETGVYLAPGLPLSIEFKTEKAPVIAKAQVCNCRMEKGCRYLAGIALNFIKPGDRERLLELVTKK